MSGFGFDGVGMSRRQAITRVGAGGMAAALAARTLTAHAQDAGGASNPIVGTWIANTDDGDPTSSPSLFVFNADGAYSQVDTDGSVGYGVWKSTGEKTSDLTIVFLNSDENGGFVGMSKARASIEVAVDGNRFTAPYTLEVILADGSTTGEYGPATAVGTRLEVETQGTPVGSISDLFNLIAPAGGTDDTGSSGSGDVASPPAATPVS